MKTCTIEGCGKRFAARGMCQTHYQGARAAGTIETRGFYDDDATCSVNQCDRRPQAFGMCSMHRRRLVRTGTTAPRQRAPWEPRFWDKVHPEPNTGCWLWGGSTFERRGGYGQFSLAHGVMARAHRLAYELLVGPIPEGLFLDHLCRVTCCVNPDHLEPVTHEVNTQRGKSTSRKSALPCRCGHAAEAHDHYRPGSDCGICGREACPKYKRITVAAARALELRAS